MNTSLTIDERREVLELSASACNGTLPADDAATLNRWMAESDEACRLYCRFVNLHVTLFRSLGKCDEALEALGSCDESVPQRSVQPSPVEPSPVEPSPVEPRRVEPVAALAQSGGTWLTAVTNRALRPVPFSIAMAVLFVACALAVMAVIRPGARPEEVAGDGVQPVQPLLTVGRITRQWGATWAFSDHDRTRRVGDLIVAGESLMLDHGMAEFTFDCGARVLLQGPSIATALSKNRGQLAAGKLTAIVPPGAEGFTIATRAAKVVDLGTEFGVEVDVHGGSTVRVFDGTVDVHAGAVGAADYHVTRLVAGEAVRVDLDRSISDVPGESTDFTRITELETPVDGLPVTEGLLVWLRADSGVVTDRNGYVLRWQDSSPNRHRLIPQSEIPDCRPKRIERAAGDRPVVAFDGAGDMLRSAEPVKLFRSKASGLTALVVFATENAGGQKFLLGHTASDGKCQIGYDVAGKVGEGNFGVNRGSSRGTVAPAGTVVAGELALYATTILPQGSAPPGDPGSLPGQATSNNVQIHKQGKLVGGLVADGPGWHAPGDYPTGEAILDVGGRADYADRRVFGSFHHGVIAEILLYRRALPDAERRQVERYLMEKWMGTTGTSD